jgi:hypothetical protein
MLARLRKPALAGLIVLCGLAWLAPSGSARRSSVAHAAAADALHGVNISSPFMGGLNLGTLSFSASASSLAHTMALARTLHAQVVRVEIPWTVLEPYGPGQVDQGALAYTDQLVADAQAHGIKLIMFAEGTPCWASSAPAPILAKCVPGQPSAAAAWPPTNDADFARYTAFLAQRYGADLAALEIWNEPDQVNEHYLAGPEKPLRYAELLRAAYPAIKAVAPTLPVLGGSLVGSNGAFLRALYKDGAKGYYDGLSVHFYHLTLASLRSIHEVQVENGDNTPLWLNEFGFSSCWPRHKIQQEQACVTRQQQASNLASLVHSVAHVPYVASAVVYKLQNSTGEEFGVVTTSGTHKLSFGALANAFASPLASPGRVRLRLRRAGGSLIAFGSAPPGDYMRLEVKQHGQLRYHALFTLNRANGYALRLPAALGTSGLSVSVYQYSLGSARAAHAYG